MVTKFIHITFLLAAITSLQAQDNYQFFIGGGLNYRLSANGGVSTKGMNGSSLEIGVEKVISNAYHVDGSLEIGAAGVSNYGALKVGLNKHLNLNSDQFFIAPGFFVIQGMGFTKPSPLYLWGISQENYMALTVGECTSVGLVIGLRYYGFPGYADYSTVYNFLDGILGLRVMF